jgi:hypothetical protein
VTAGAPATAALDAPAVLAEFFDAVQKKARALTPSGLDERTKLEGCFWLMEFADMVLEVFAHRDPVHPVVMPIVSPFRRFMGDHSLGRWNYVVELDPRYEYRLWCRPGDATFHSITVQSGGGLPLLPTAAVLGKLNNRELTYEADGTFVITLGGSACAGNWIPLGTEPAGLLTREFFYASPLERTEAVWRIENITGGEPLRPSDAHLTTSLRTALETFVEAADRYPLPVGQALFAQGGLNNFGELTHFTESNMPTWGNLDAFHTTLSYELEPDEAILIEGGRAVPCAWWGITQNNRYVASFALQEMVNLHGGNIELEDDGTWRAVLSERDPSRRNWITTAGHRHGIVRIRWLIADEIPQRPRTSRVKVTDLAP